MKKCPFCAEEIQDAALKCKHCGSMLNDVPPSTIATAQPATWSMLDLELTGVLSANGKIAAIKRLRELRPMGLAEAKTYVEALQRRVNPQAVAAPKHTASGFGCLVALLATVAAVGYYRTISGPLWERLIPPPGGVASAPSRQSHADEAPAIEISAAELAQAYEENGVAADQRFKGKRVLVSGTIDSIGKNIANTPYITLSSGGQSGPRRVQAVFDRLHEGQLAALVKGSPARIEGRCEGMFGNILIKDVVLK